MVTVKKVSLPIFWEKTADGDYQYRTLCEIEWYRLYDLHVEQLDPKPANINLAHWASSCPVNLFKFGPFADIIGNVWQWTETAIDGFEGFEVHPAYDDFFSAHF